jgi:hypothetical protein
MNRMGNHKLPKLSLLYKPMGSAYRDTVKYRAVRIIKKNSRSQNRIELSSWMAKEKVGF